MTEELKQAVSVIISTCDGQENCVNCPLEDICGLMPCDWIF